MCGSFVMRYSGDSGGTIEYWELTWKGFSLKADIRCFSQNFSRTWRIGRWLYNKC